MPSHERREAGDILVADVEPVRPQLVHRGVHVPRVEEDDGVEDQAERAELVLSELAEHGFQLAFHPAFTTESSCGEVGQLGAVGRVADYDGVSLSAGSSPPGPGLPVRRGVCESLTSSI